MKKITILSKLKVWQEYCQTFSCRLKAGFSDFFETSRSTKRLVFYVTLLLLGIGFISNSYGQDVGSSAVKANFGIDGDAYSGLFKFQTNPPPNPAISGPYDDWFLGASGLGVIDQAIPPFSNPASDAIPNPMTNTSFQRRQSIFAPTAPFPFPVVPLEGYKDDDPSTWSGKYLWLDAVYGRDTYVKGGSAETSYFAGGADKNSDNPNSWTIGTAGSVPQKTDIIDVYAHLRGQDIRIPFSDVPDHKDPRPFGTLWAYAGASLVVTNGNKHVDFEFFRTALSKPADLSVPGATGPDGGRTAFTFDPLDGSVAIPGTIIISVDYINGGNVPSIRVRVWMSQATFDGYTTKVNSPFNVDKSVAFEKGTGSGVYGYAAINPIGSGVNMWGRVNDDFATFENSRTQAPPWHTWEGTTPTDVDMYTRYQFVEIGINLTAFGLDKRGEQSPCSNLLGSLLVKTRSSGGGPNESAFGSELKDFAGPYLFGFTGEQPEIAAKPLVKCENGATGKATFDLNEAIDTENSTAETTITFHNNEIDAEEGDNPIISPESYDLEIANSPKTIWVRSLRPGSECDNVTSFTVTVNANPTVTVNSPTICADAISATITATPSPAGTYTYKWTVPATATDPGNVASFDASVAGEYSVVITDGTSTKCTGTGKGKLTINANPTVTVNSPTICASDKTGKITATPSPAGTYTYKWTVPATATDPGNVASFDASVAGKYTVVITDGTSTKCTGTGFGNLTINANPTVTVNSPTICASDKTGKITATPSPAGTYTYKWTVPATATDPGNVASFDASVAGKYTVVITDGTNTKCTGTGNGTLTINANPTCEITGEQTICAGDSSTFTAVAGMKSYSWTGPGGFTSTDREITVTVAGIYEVTITNSNDCSSKCSRELTVESCGGPLCTYTQGAYGNSGGKYCDGTDAGISTTNLIAQALANAGNSITIGKPGQSVIMSLGDEGCIIKVMPGGGKASELPAVNIGICSLTPPYLKNGRINNVLLSQTIAMALNINITSPSDLGGFILQAGTLATAKPAGGCGSDIPKVRVCGYYEGDIWVPTVNEYTYRTFSAAVINAITADGNGKKTVAGLLDLANRALANVDGTKNMEDGVSLSEIAGAVGSINEVFDECAIFIGWDVSKCSPEPVDSSTTSKIELAGFTASPVPFRDVLKIKYNFDYVSNVKIEVFNPQGKVVLTKLDTNSYLNKEISLTLSSNIEQEQVYIVKLTTDRGSSTKTVMSSQ
ncbi:Por secretion system C-terminal sorting domain-containing protein [Flavobacterium gillisiae]|uniref:Por secretion system C-terminal sorting domain-containing protein n=1 Tax=Flavobacterium gillisiae TaxID=150146 RepID=A0A1H3XW58_9FLAO|nr:T9SS type A sorting domain-containing protein [Flavobacterium gillisiae]SEA03705.1 Por secretion system C-terminal sorting domain-containing protein [Flavobacterium gillisiae]